MTRIVPLVALAAALLTGCGTLSPPPPLPPPPTLAAADTLARGQVGQIVRIHGGTIVGVRFTDVAADSVRGAQGERPLAVATREVREIVILGEPIQNARPPIAAAACAAPYVIGGAEQLIRGQEESACIDPEQTPLATVAGGAFAGLIGYIVARQVFPEGPRTDLVIPLTPLSRFADAPREGVGLWRPR